MATPATTLAAALAASLAVRCVTRRTVTGSLATARLTAGWRRWNAGCGTPSCVQCALRMPLAPGKHRAT